MLYGTWIRERSRTVQMQGGNDVDYPGAISTLLPTQQMRRYRAAPQGGAVKTGKCIYSEIIQ